MSTYESYAKVAGSYDGMRVPVGAEIIFGHLSLVGRPLGDFALLDAGCGTGNYSRALAGQVGKVTSLDLSPDMLAVARAKLEKEEQAGRVAFREGSITALPFPEACFDGVMFNQVLHHLEDGKDPDYPGHGRAVAEAFRVLKPGGVVVINVCTHEQLKHGFWYYDLIPGALAAVLGRCVSAERLTAHIKAAGFRFHGRSVPLDGLLFDDGYFQAEGPLEASWRKADSIWALADGAELAAAEARIESLRAAGQLEAYLGEQDRARQALGQCTFFTGQKPS
ncbi:MAG: class I SAM-dependent methyltransferase [Pseudomonadota bacterium]